ncbi:hypothetical protein D3C81_1760940 [compost metagenome]
MQATTHCGTGNFRAVADLCDGQVPLALLERLHHRKATGQRRHEVRITRERLDPLGRRSDDRRRDGSKGVTQLIVHSGRSPEFVSYYRLPQTLAQATGSQLWAIIEPSADNRNQPGTAERLEHREPAPP